MNISNFLNRLLTKPKDPFIAYDWAEIQEIEKSPKEYPIWFMLHLVYIYKLYRVIKYDIKNALC